MLSVILFLPTSMLHHDQVPDLKHLSLAGNMDAPSMRER